MAYNKKNNFNEMDNDQRRKLEEKYNKRMEREAKKAAKREKNEARYEKNTIAWVGFLLACNCIWISFTGWYVWLDFLAIILCGIGLSSKRPKNFRKYLALIGVGLAVISICNAVRVSNNFIVDKNALSEITTYESVLEEETAE